jgi:hypothetical protein
MDDKDSVIKKIEDGITDAAKSVEDFVDEVSAPQAPVVIVPAEDSPADPPKGGSAG